MTSAPPWPGDNRTTLPIPLSQPVWELRVHGVSNTPPESILRTGGDREPPPGESLPLRLVAGDETTGFYRYASPTPGDPRFSVEAFSWGQLTSGRRIQGERVVKDLRRSAWSLLLPFALVNVALWARPAVSATPGDRGSARVLADLVRLMAMTLTMTLTMTAAGVGMDLLTWQCRDQCTRTLPGTGWLSDPWFAVDGRLIVLGALIPLSVIVAMGWLSGKTFHYEAVSPAVPEPAVPEPAESVPAESVAPVRDHLVHPLADKGFWAGSGQVRTLRRFHTVAALATVAHLLAASSWSVNSAGHTTRWPALAVSLSALTLICLAAVGLLQHGSIADRAADQATGRAANRAAGWLVRAGRALVGVTVALVVAAAVIAAFGPGPNRSGGARLPGLEATVRALFLVQFVILIGCLVANLIAERAAAATNRRGAQDDPAWRGLATTLFTGAAWTLALLISCAVLFGVAWWLNGGSGVSRFRAQVAPTMQWAACGLALGAVAVTVAALAVGVIFVRLRANQTEVVCAQLPNASPHEQAAAAEAARWRALHRLDGYHCLTIIGWLGTAILGIAALGAMVAALDVAAWWAPDARAIRWAASPGRDVVPPPLPSTPDVDLSWLSNLGALVAIGLMLGLVVLVGAAYRSTAVRRTVGVVWDVVTFWPRGAHPFAPPCYAERAVPQLLTRISGKPDQPLILAGHSQGSLLVAACVFQLSPQRRRSVFLLTFGTQITRLYGRAFPAFFGREARLTLAEGLREGGDPHMIRWRSLWRPTDPIGWPVACDERDVMVDVPVQDPTGYLPEPCGEVLDPPVRQHSDYPESAEYQQQRELAFVVLNGSGLVGTPRG